MPKRDIYQEVTDKMLAALEAGTKPWVCPWDRSGVVSLPINESSGDYYRGINVPMLWMAQGERGFTSSRWMTYKQAKAKGGQVRKGEKGTTVVFFKTLEKDTGETDADTGEEIKNRVPMLRTFTVFNLDQIDGIEQPEPLAVGEGFEPIDQAEAVLRASGVTIHEGGARAFYRPSTDEITMPARDRFDNAYDYYATALHELTHATKHESRCDRKPYDAESLKVQYAFEELVAEIGSMFATASLGLTGDVQGHADYLESWLTLLRSDKRAIFKAAAQAQRAHEWIANATEQAQAA